jgi:hypothetical protein
VTAKRATGNAETPFILPTPLHKGDLADFEGRRVTPSQLRQTKFQTPQALLSMPTFQSPLMSGHVTGLHQTRSGPSGKFRASRFFHDSLVAEHKQFAAKLDGMRSQQAAAERSAAELIQRLWRVFIEMRKKAKEGRSKERRRKHELRISLRRQLWARLGEDPRCAAWAFSALQRQVMTQVEAEATAAAAGVNKKALPSRVGGAVMPRKTSQPKKPWQAARGAVRIGSSQSEDGSQNGSQNGDDASLDDSSGGSRRASGQSTSPLSAGDKAVSPKEKGKKLSKGKASFRTKTKSGKATSETDDLLADIDSWAAQKASTKLHHREAKAQHDLLNSDMMLEAKRLGNMGNALAEEKAKEKEAAKERAKLLKQRKKPY